MLEHLSLSFPENLERTFITHYIVFTLFERRYQLRLTATKTTVKKTTPPPKNNQIKQRNNKNRHFKH